MEGGGGGDGGGGKGGRGGGRGGWVNLLKMENLWQKYFFLDNAEWNSKYFWKKISAV